MKKYLINFFIWLAVIWLINSALQKYAGKGFFFLTVDIAFIRLIFAAIFATNAPLVK